MSSTPRQLRARIQSAVLVCACLLLGARAAQPWDAEPDPRSTPTWGSASQDAPPPPPPPPLPSSAATVRGRVIDEGGQPLADALIELGPPGYTKQGDLDWVAVYEPGARTGPDGRFEFKLELDEQVPAMRPARAKTYSRWRYLRISAPGFVSTTRSLSEPIDGAYEGGDIPLRRGTPVQLALEDPTGRVLYTGCSFLGPDPLEQAVKRLDRSEAGTVPRPKTGIGRTSIVAPDPVLPLGREGVRIQAMEAGRQRLLVRHSSGAQADLELDVPPWSPEVGVVQARAVYTGPDTAELRVVEFSLLSSLPLSPAAALAPSGLEVRGRGGPLPLRIGFDPASARPFAEARAAGPAKPPSTRARSRSYDEPVERIYVQHALAEQLELILDDPRFLPEVVALLPDGQVTKVTLEGNSTLLLEVVEQGSGRAIADYTVWRRSGDSRSYRLSTISSPTQGSGGSRRILRGLLPDPETLRISADGYLDLDIELAAITPGGRRDLRVELERDLSGEPPASLEVLAPEGLAPFELVLSDSKGRVRRGSIEGERGLLEDLIPGRYRVGLRALGSNGRLRFAIAFPEELQLAPGEARVWQLDLALHTGRVRLLDAAGQPLRRARPWLQGDPRQDPADVARDPARLATDAEGWLELTLPAATFRLFPPGKAPPDRTLGADWARTLAFDWPAAIGTDLRLP